MKLVGKQLMTSSRASVRRTLLFLLSIAYIYKPLQSFYVKRYRNQTDQKYTGKSATAVQNDDPSFGMPPMPSSLKLFQALSWLVNSYVILKAVFPFEALLRRLPLEPRLEPHCYLPGRLSFGPWSANADFPQTMSLLMTIFHMGWRSYQLVTMRPYQLDTFMFVLQDDVAINEGYRRRSASEREVSSGTYSRFLSSMMYYPVWHERGVTYRLRPNRTQRAREHLFSTITYTFKGITLLVALLMLPLVMPFCLLDEQHLRNYPGCFPELERRGEIGWSVTLSWRLILVGPIDALENLFVWGDMALGVLHFCALLAVLNSDLFCYWRQLHARLEDMLYRLKVDRSLEALDELARVRSASYLQLQQTRPFYQPLTRRSVHYDGEVHDLQAQLSDFFRQIRLVDRYTSDIISTATLVWFISFAAVSYLGISAKSAQVSSSVRIYQTIGFLVLSLVSVVLVGLHRATSATYRVVCSVMAHDQSRYKRQFTKILDNYSKFGKPTYTIFHQHPIKPSTFLTIVSWTFSSIIITESLFKQ